MMKFAIFLISTLIFFCGTLAYSQETDLYDENGKLKIDNAYKVDKNVLIFIENLEKIALPGVYESINYPKLAYENGIEGMVIAKIIISRGDLSIYCKIESACDPSLGKAVEKAFYDNSLILYKALKTNEKIEFYVPFESKVRKSSFMEELNKNKLIKIEKSYLERPKKLL